MGSFEQFFGQMVINKHSIHGASGIAICEVTCHRWNWMFIPPSDGSRSLQSLQSRCNSVAERNFSSQWPPQTSRYGKRRVTVLVKFPRIMVVMNNIQSSTACLFFEDKGGSVCIQSLHYTNLAILEGSKHQQRLLAYPQLSLSDHILFNVQ